MPDGRYWLQTLGCPKNQVDSDKLAGVLDGEGYAAAQSPGEADLVVVNTCAFIEAARQESIDTVLALADARAPGSRLVVTGCMAERYGRELADALPEVDLVAGFGRSLVALPGAGSATPVAPATGTGAPVQILPSRGRHRRSAARAPARGSAHAAAGPPAVADDAPGVADFDLLALPRPAAAAPWAYVKVAEGCDRRCGFCAIPSFRGVQRSRPAGDVLAEVAQLAADPAMPVREIVLVAQDLASYGRDRSGGSHGRTRPVPLVALTEQVRSIVARTRLLYLYPSGLTEELIDAVLATGVPYFDLSLQHVSRPLLARMRRWGDGSRFLERIARIRSLEPAATFRSSFILGYPGETEEDHDALLAFLAEAQLDWAGFFPFSRESGTLADGLEAQVPATLAMERLRECAELQDGITARRRDAMVGRVHQVLVDAPGRARTVHEAPEIDGIVRVPRALAVGSMVDVTVTASLGTDLVGEPVASSRAPAVYGRGGGRRPGPAATAGPGA